MGEQVPVARADRVTIYCPYGGRYAFYNSPYPAHILSTGIDVYPGMDFGEMAGSPVAGRVITIRRVKTPKGRNFKDHGYDTVTLIRSLQNPSRLIKILHIEPTVQVGELLEPGHELGQLIRSGYFGFSTAPHIHLEVRDTMDPLRARGGLNLERLQKISNISKLKEMRGTVLENRKEYSIVQVKGTSRVGLQCDIGEIRGILDGGIPYYGWMGVHTDVSPSIGASIRLCGREIGYIKETTKAGCVATCRDISFSVDDTPVGLSLFLYPRLDSLIFLVPTQPMGLQIKTNSEVSIEIAQE